MATRLGVSAASASSSKRATFVIDTDRTVLDVIHRELSMGAHADRALALLKARPAA